MTSSTPGGVFTLTAPLQTAFVIACAERTSNGSESDALVLRSAWDGLNGDVAAKDVLTKVGDTFAVTPVTRAIIDLFAGRVAIGAAVEVAITAVDEPYARAAIEELTALQSQQTDLVPAALLHNIDARLS